MCVFISRFSCEWTGLLESIDLIFIHIESVMFIIICFMLYFHLIYDFYVSNIHVF